MEKAIDKDILKVNPEDPRDLKKLGKKIQIIQFWFKVSILFFIIGLIVFVIALFTDLSCYYGLIISIVALFLLIMLNRKQSNMINSGEELGIIKIKKSRKIF
jgi:hypothetical protein